MTNEMKAIRKYNKSQKRKGKGKRNKKIAERYLWNNLLTAPISVWWSRELKIEDEIRKKYPHNRACNLIRCFYAAKRKYGFE